jgi:hypothetical protein
MKRFLLALTIFASTAVLFGQEPYLDFYKISTRNNTSGMIALGSWAAANLAVGAVGWSRTTGAQKYFHQMNFFWNTVNMGIVGFSLYSNAQTDPGSMTGADILQGHRTIENLYLINAGLDVIYMGTGMYLRHRSQNNSKRPDLLRGYGNSIILQGGFLFIFDGIMWAVQRNLRTDFLDGLSLSASNFGTGVQFTWTF